MGTSCASSSFSLFSAYKIPESPRLVHFFGLIPRDFADVSCRPSCVEISTLFTDKFQVQNPELLLQIASRAPNLFPLNDGPVALFTGAQPGEVFPILAAAGCGALWSLWRRLGLLD